MTRHLLSFLGAATLIAVCAIPQAFAQTMSTTTYNTRTSNVQEHPWELGIQGGVLMPKADRLDSKTPFVDGRLTYDVTPNVAVGAESGGMYYKDETNGHKYGYLRGIPILADLVLKMPIPATDNRLVPYAVGGVGAIVWNYDQSSYSDSAGIDLKRWSTSFATRVGGGVDYYITDNVAIFGEASYMFSKYEPKLRSGSAPIESKINTGGTFIGGGLKFRM